MVLVTDGLIEASDYDAIALEVNRIFSDTSDGAGGAGSLTFLSNKILDTTAPITATNQSFAFTTDVENPSYIVADVGGTTLLPSEYNVDLENDEITILISVAAGAQVRAFNRDAHIFGWGQAASVYPHPTLPSSTRAKALILEANTNNLIDKINIMTERVGSNVELTRVAPRQLVRATDFTTITNTLNSEVLPGLTPWNNDIATVDTTVATSTRTTPWSEQLIGVCYWVFPDYNKARYFFNSGCEIRANISMTGDPGDAGYANWSQVANQMGSLIMDWRTTRQTGTGGISNGIGFYHLTENWQTVFTSASPLLGYSGDPDYSGENSGEYPGEYSPIGEYSNLVIRWEARWSTDQGSHTVQIRVTMDDSTFTNQDIAGTTSYNAGWKLADDITDNSAVFSVDAPTVTHVDQLTSSNDS